MSQHNADYDSANLYVDPDALKPKVDILKQQSQNTAESLQRINDTLSALQLNWAGDTADEAQKFGKRWTSVMKELFGGKDHPEKGVLNAIVEGLLATRGNFSNTEEALVQLFKQFDQDMSGGDTTTPTSPPPSINDINVTAILETW